MPVGDEPVDLPHGFQADKTIEVPRELIFALIVDLLAERHDAQLTVQRNPRPNGPALECRLQFDQANLPFAQSIFGQPAQIGRRYRQPGRIFFRLERLGQGNGAVRRHSEQLLQQQFAHFQRLGSLGGLRAILFEGQQYPFLFESGEQSGRYFSPHLFEGAFQAASRLPELSLAFPGGEQGHIALGDLQFQVPRLDLYL